MHISSPAFQSNDVIPKKYSRKGENINPPLSWKDVPVGAKTLALIMEDPDIPAAVGVPVWDHWLVWNIPSDLTEIPEAWEVVGIRGKGTRGELVYGGPNPPDREHRYFFRLYAADIALALTEGSTKLELLKELEGHVLAEAVLMGRFSPTDP